MLGNAARVDLENLQSRSLVRQRDLDLAVQSPRAQQRGVQRVWAVRRHHHLHLAEIIEAVELVEQLHERALDLAIGRGSLRETATTDGVDLIHENHYTESESKAKPAHTIESDEPRSSARECSISVAQSA